MPKRRRIAWFSTWFKDGYSRSLSAYFSSRLIPLLNERYEIEFFSADFSGPSDIPCFHYLKAFEEHRSRPYDLFIYNLENSKSAYFARTHLALIPGVVVFHDLLFGDFGPEPILNSAWRHTVKKFHSSAEPFPDRAQEHRQSGPQGYREAAFAPAAVFMNERSHEQYIREVEFGLLGRSERLSYYLSYPIEPFDVCAGDLQAIDRFRVGIIGPPRIENRTHKALLALQKLGEASELHWMVGSEEERKLASDLHSEYRLGEVRFYTNGSPEVWREIAANIDCAMHLRFSVFGQVEPYLGISLMAGRAVLVTDFGDSCYLPDSLMFKIVPGEIEAGQIAEVLRTIRTGAVPPADKISAYASERYDPGMVAEEFSSILEQSFSTMSSIMQNWQALEVQARQEVLNEQAAHSGPFKDQFRELGLL
ncbi:MAG: hypothetical protein DCC75_11445 [Proteobacteria bacterium]|nr:MAG: hypothetical protein DCC75_11445 [Pseudomonadota bacterium]